MQFFKPANYFEVRDALIAEGRQDLIGDGCDCLIPGRPPVEALEKRGAGRAGRPLSYGGESGSGGEGRRARGGAGEEGGIGRGGRRRGGRAMCEQEPVAPAQSPNQPVD